MSFSIYVSGASNNQPLSERVKTRRIGYGGRVRIENYTDSPEETFRRVVYLIRDAQENANYCFELRDWALSIIRDAGASSHDDMIVAIYDWVKCNVTYTKDPVHNELIHSAEVLMQRYFSGNGIYGDCDDFTILTCSLLLALGIPCRARMIKLPQPDGSIQYSHIYPMAMLSNGEFIALDATEAHEPIGWEPPNYGAKDFTF